MTYKVNPSASLAANGTVGQNNALYGGYTVTVATATGPINVRNGTISGQILDVIPASTAAGVTKSLSNPMCVDDGIFVEFNGGATGTVVIHYV